MPRSEAPPLREDTHGVIPYTGFVDPPKERFWDIEYEKANLVAFREECTTDEERAAVDAEIAKYIGIEIRKVSKIAGLLRWFKWMAESAKLEEDRITEKRKRWESRHERLKAMVLGVMQALDIPKVEGATDRLRRQKNPVALEITDAAAIPIKYLRATIRMPFAEWGLLVEAAAMSGKPFSPRLDSLQVTSEVDTVALKAACSAKVPCLECAQTAGSGPDPLRIPNCEICNGTGMVSATVPGARLVQGEHLGVE